MKMGQLTIVQRLGLRLSGCSWPRAIIMCYVLRTTTVLGLEGLRVWLAVRKGLDFSIAARR